MASTAGSQDQRKRTLEALERRFAVAKAELLHQQKKNKKLSVDEDAKETLGSNSSISDASTATPSKKGSMADKILHELLQSGDSAQKYMQGSRSVKIDNWILLDNYVQGRPMSTGSHIRALKIHSKRSKRHMSMKQLKKSGALKLPQALQKFDMFKPMHEMWKGYMNQLRKINGKNQLAQCLLGADLHGALILG
ncbi:hypothetical protein CCACVL1_17710 [Corchorus capsularis]|uniref:Uncharacterized protein n=1 Tax=Corchorus capsularis TaxID=210143 RepID=A0A1R3HQ86_COCAP|nr:hypothetical protein CCACVL1_17710 [Corchorus capsularis]